MKSIYSVYQLNTYIHNMFGEDILLSEISVSGEISNLKYHSSGHIYFTLKDLQSAVSCAIFRSSASKLSTQLKDGDKIIATGSVNNYIPNGSITFNVTSVKSAGIGELTIRYEELKQKLKEQGLFDNEFKQPIPKFPKKVGIVTAPTGAAVRDIISVSKRRNPYISLILYPAIVQGSEAAPSIVAGINALEEYGVDVIIVGRGGGSIEDLWAFNEEEVAYAIFQSSVPVISAVGHEVDFTIADFVADMRAATPSAAAELAVPDVMSVINDIEKLDKRLNQTMLGKVDKFKNRLKVYEANLDKSSPINSLQKKKLLNENYNKRLDYLMKSVISNKKHRIDNLSERLKGVSPLERLSQGMAYVTDNKGIRISGISGLNMDDELKVIMKDGIAVVAVKCIQKEAYDGQ